jgi:hypothetical protein
MEHSLFSIVQTLAADAHTLAAISWLNGPPTKLCRLVHFAERQQSDFCTVSSYSNCVIRLLYYFGCGLNHLQYHHRALWTTNLAKLQARLFFSHCLQCHRFTKQAGCSTDSSDLCSESGQFKSQPRHQLFCLMFFPVSFSSYRQIPHWCLLLGPDHFFLYLFNLLNTIIESFGDV